MNARNQPSKGNHGEEVVLVVGLFVRDGGVVTSWLMKVRQWYLIFHSLNASLGKVQLEMVQVLIEDASPVCSLDWIRFGSRPIHRPAIYALASEDDGRKRQLPLTT